MATRSKQKTTVTKPDPNRLAEIKKQCENRVFLLNGNYTFCFVKINSNDTAIFTQKPSPLFLPVFYSKFNRCIIGWL